MAPAVWQNQVTSVGPSVVVSYDVIVVEVWVVRGFLL